MTRPLYSLIPFISSDLRQRIARSWSVHTFSVNVIPTPVDMPNDPFVGVFCLSKMLTFHFRGGRVPLCALFGLQNC